MTVRSIGVVSCELALPDQLRDQVDDEHDLEVEVVAEEAGVDVDEGEVVVRVEAENPLRAGLPPVV